MHARALKSRGISGVHVLALALLLASCKTPVRHDHTVGGIVSGLASAGLVLQNNGSNNLPVSANGPFIFPATLSNGSSYNVTVFAQPSGGNCTVANGTGILLGNVRDVEVNCAATAATIGGTVSGLASTGLVLQNNGADDLPVAADGNFTFATPVADGGNYNVTVSTQPSGQNCTVANGSGSVAGASVTNVAVSCLLSPPAAPTLSLVFGLKELQFTWTAVSGADFYRLLENPDGVSGYVQAGPDLTALSINLTIPVHRRLNASYIVEACNVSACTPSAPQILGASLTQAIGYFKASSLNGADSNRVNDQFGFVVALSDDGNTLAVGAPNEDSSTFGVNTAPNEGASNAGAVYVYARTSGTWAMQAYLKASNAGANDLFGNTLALSADGNTLAVGAPGEASSTTGIGTEQNNGASFAGAVYVFTRSAGTWSEQAFVKASNTNAFDFFGNSVALSADGNTLVAGAPFESSNAAVINGNQADNSLTNAGAAYVFTRSAGSWSQQAYVKASNPGASDWFGWSVALSGDGDTLAVGAPLEDSALTGVTLGSVNEAVALNAAPDSGAVYLFTRSAGAWSQDSYVKPSNTGGGDQFGYALALSGDGNTLAIGAPREDSSSTGVDSVPSDLLGTLNDPGAVYVFARGGGGWSQQAYIKASNTGTGDWFGSSVALNGDGSAVVVGAIQEDGLGTGVGSVSDDSAADAGAVYSYVRNNAGAWAQEAYVKASNTGAGDRFGVSVALSGDGNTLAVGAHCEDSASTGISSTPNESTTDAGAVYLY